MRRAAPDIPLPESQEAGPDAKPETKGTLLGGFNYESRPSAKHEHRNEDAVGGDTDRIERDIAQAEAGELPIMTTNMKFDTSVVLNAAKREEKYCLPCVENGTHWVMDGASGEEMGATIDGEKVKLEGIGMVASRIASAEIARVMSELPEDADDDTAIEKMKQAILTADATTNEYKKRQPNRAYELKDAGCAATLFNSREREDGTLDIRYASVGDTALAVYNPETGVTEQRSRSSDIPNFLLDTGGLTKEEADYVLNVPRDAGDIPANLKAAVENRQRIMKAIGGTETMDADKFMILLDVVGSFDKDDIDMIRQTESPDDLMEALIDEKKLPRIKKALEYKAKIKEAGGILPLNDPETGVISLRPGEKLIAYSDGLDGNLTPEEISDVLAKGGNLAEVARAKNVKEDDISIIEFENPKSEADGENIEELDISEFEEIDIEKAEALTQKDVEDTRSEIEEMEDFTDDVEMIPEPPPSIMPPPQKKKGGFFRGLFGGK